MKTYQLIFIYLLSLLKITVLKAQTDGIAIGMNSPNESAILHIQPESNNKGLLIPRLSSDPSNNTIGNIDNPADGLVVYDIYIKGFVYWDESLPDIPTTKPDKWVQVIPQGMITMWSGTTPPNGWALCNGSNNTPDLRGRFIVSYDNRSASMPTIAGKNDINYGETGNRGGLNGVVISQAEMPSHRHSGSTSTDGNHSHNANLSFDYTGARGKKVGKNSGKGEDGADDEVYTINTSIITNNRGDHSHSFTTNSTGNGNAHENRPPYYVLAFIMKL